MTSPAHVTLLHGGDEFAISEAIDKACSGLGDPSTADMNITRLDCRLGVDFENLNSAVNALPFLAPRRVAVLLNPASAFSAAEARRKFFELLEKSQPTTTIVLAEFDELKKDHWLLKWAAASNGLAVVYYHGMPARKEMPRWIESEAHKQKGKFDPGAAARLAELTGEDTRVAALEVTKLLTYVNYARPISMVDVEQVSVDSAQGRIFDLVDALAQGEGKTAQHILHKLLEYEDAFEFWPMVIRQFRLILQVRELLESNANVGEIQRQLGLHPFVAGKVSEQARRFSMASLERIHHRLLEIDEAAKISRVPLELALDTLVVELSQRG
jgi:DNA polymerase III subunit delta